MALLTYEIEGRDLLARALGERCALCLVDGARIRDALAS